jgi:hypothetical protein
VQGSQTERVSAALNYNHRLFDDWLNVTGTCAARGRTTSSRRAAASARRRSSTRRRRSARRSASSSTAHFALAPNNPVAELGLGVVEGTTFRASPTSRRRLPPPVPPGAERHDPRRLRRGRVRAAHLLAQHHVGAAEVRPARVRQPLEPRGADGVAGDASSTSTTRFDAFNSDVDATAGYSYERSHGDYPFFEAIGPEHRPARRDRRCRPPERRSAASASGRTVWPPSSGASTTR